ncbi:MAG: matrixin family metalloprotease [Gemmataceae bacterium]|nr:matrixin family metalloprotease [Gemmataceae bacterium]
MKKPNSRALLLLEALEERCTPTVWNNPWPDAAHLTMSFAPDGTAVGPQTSDLFATLNAQMPASQWQMEALRAWQTWAVNANVNIGIVPDSGLAFGTSGPAQGDSRFGDIRLAAYPMAEQALAIASPFEAALGTWSGDMKLNNTVNFGPDGYDLFTVFLHEAGHTLGLNLGADPTSAMAASYSGPRSDISASDKAALQALYGVRAKDSYEGAANNNTFPTATRLNLLALEGGLTTGNAEADITTANDDDFYKFTVPLYLGGLTVRVQTQGLSLLTPRVTVYNSAKKVIKTVASTTPNGGNIEIRLPSIGLFQTYYVKVEGARSDVFGIGGYNLTVDSLPGVTGLVQGAGGAVGGLLSLINVDLHTNDSFLTGTLLGGLLGQTTTSSRFDHAYKASIHDSWDVDYYKITAPTAPAGLDSSVMTVMAWGLNVGGLDPRVTVFDADQQVVAAQVLVNDNGSYTIQVPNAGSEATYYVKVEAAAPQGERGTGNYFLGIDFSTKAVELDEFVDGQLTASAPDTTFQLTTKQTQLHHFVLSATTANPAVEAAVRMTIYDCEGRVVATRVAKAGETVSFDVALPPGTFFVRFAAGTKDKSAALPALSFKLKGLVASDPIGPPVTDPTCDPSSSPPPPDSSSTPTSDASPPPQDPPPCYTPTSQQYSPADPYGDPYSPT